MYRGTHLDLWRNHSFSKRSSTEYDGKRESSTTTHSIIHYSQLFLLFFGGGVLVDFNNTGKEPNSKMPQNTEYKIQKKKISETK